jgi:hypothetical protein
VQLQVLVLARSGHEVAIENGAIPGRSMPAVRAVILSNPNAHKNTNVRDSRIWYISDVVIGNERRVEACTRSTCTVFELTESFIIYLQKAAELRVMIIFPLSESISEARLPCQRTYQAIRDPCAGARQKATKIRSRSLLWLCGTRLSFTFTIATLAEYHRASHSTWCQVCSSGW